MIQTRNHLGEILDHKTLQDALAHAREDQTVWKISFEIIDGSRVRLIKTDEGWTYENIFTGNRND
jgi:hypothetical protein